MVPEAGYNQEEINIPEAMQRLEKHIENLPGMYKRFSVEELIERPAPGKWSKQEILGHLIDSAINNLKRFTEIQFLPQPYHIISYQQNELVIVNNYQYIPVDHLLQLWQSLNRQIIYVAQPHHWGSWHRSYWFVYRKQSIKHISQVVIAKKKFFS
jgi:hypothetical protein